MLHLLIRGDAETGEEEGDTVTSPVVLNDLRLAKEAAKDRQVAEKLLARLAPRIRQAVYLAVGRDQEADDLTHVCLVEILENLHHYRGTGPLEAWAGKLSYRVMMRQLSKRRRTERTEPLTDVETGISGDDPEQETSREKLRRRLAHHLGKLPAERRMTLILRLIHQHSVAEVAELMGVPVNTVRDRIRVGLKELRTSISKDPLTRDYLTGKSHG